MKTFFGSSIAFVLAFLAAGVAWHNPALADDPERAPTGVVTDPKGLLVQADGLEFRFSYFPSLDRLRVLVLRAPKQFVAWDVTLAPQGRSEVLARRAGKLPMAEAGETIPVPSLADGTYEVTLT
ncbi:MAG: hypothetical protein WCG85_05180, partial [Polyangia bacterium]